MSENEKRTSIGEWLAILFILLVLCALAMPFNSGISKRSEGTKALVNAKQIGLACKLFAGDFNGKYPTNLLGPDQKLTQTPPANANEVFAQLVPDYIPDEKCFWLAVPDGYCKPGAPDGKKPWVGPGENHWAYITNLTETSEANFPLVMDSTVVGGLTYSSTPGTPGGTWKGRAAIVIYVDGSGAIETVDPKTMAISDSAHGISNILRSDQKNWLKPENRFLNPIAP